MKLFRPVGLHELSFIWDSGMRGFPPRLPHQPIFYPVISAEYANEIASKWNTRDEASGFAGYVTSFAVSESYLDHFEPQTVGTTSHVEYWIPADELPAFNASIESLIDIEAAWFGRDFRGFIPERFGLKGKDAVEQFVILCNTWDYSRMDFSCEVGANRKAIYLNFLFWMQFDFTLAGIGPGQKSTTIERLIDAWDRKSAGIPLPKLNTG